MSSAKKEETRGVLMCGSLWKSGFKHRNQGGQRFFVLYGPKRPGLAYFMEEKQFKANQTPKKTYDLEGCSLTCPGRSTKKAEVIGLFHPVRGQLLLKCPCPIQCEWWMEALEGVLTKKEVLARSDFDVIKMVGKGSFGMVLQVRKKDSGSIYALKVLDKKHVESKADNVKATKNERKVLEIVNHPFIVKLHYAFQTNGALCLVMDFVNGGELFAHLKREGMFSESDSCLWAAEILLALEYLHQMGIIYRDLKPENVLLDPHGHVKLTDFGLAREEADKEGLFAVAGSAYYMAPEIVLMKGHGVQADWWSLGVLIYEMLTGLPPFYEQDARAGYQKLLTRPIEYPQHVSSNARKLINGLLCTDPEKRLGCMKSSVDPAAGGIASFPTEADGLHIKQQAWFRKLDFSKVLMKQLRPKMVPPAKDILDTSNFDEVFTNDETWKYSAFMRDASVHELLRDEPQKDAFGQDFNFKKKTPFRRPRRYSLPDATSLDGSFDADDSKSPTTGPRGQMMSPGSSMDSDEEGGSSIFARSKTLAADSAPQGMRQVRMPERPTLRLAPWSLQCSKTLSVESFRSRAQNSRAHDSNALEACPLPKEGWLMKRGQTFSKKWRQRWVKLIPSLGCVMYYKDGQQLTPKGVFGLPGPEAITCNEGMYREGGKVFVYSFTVSVDVREFEFICESLGERDQWLSALRATAARWKHGNNPQMQLCRMTSRQKRGVIRSFLNFGAAAAAQFTNDDGRWHGVLGDGSTVDMVGEWVVEEGAQSFQKGRYDGMVDRSGFWNGRGLLHSYTGCFRDGYWERGMQGRLVLVVYPSGDFYEGEWHSMARDTRDTAERKSKDIVNTHGHRTGFGIMFRANGDCYEGEWLNDLEHGTGMAYYHLGGEVCVGDYARGVRDGYGVLYYPNGTVYDGGWRSGKKSGVGVMFEPTEEDPEPAQESSPVAIPSKGQRRASHESGDVSISFTRVASDSSVHSRESSVAGSFKDGSGRGVKKARSFRCIDGQQIEELAETLRTTSSIRLNPSVEDKTSEDDAIPAIDEGEEHAPEFEDARGFSNSSLDGKDCLMGSAEDWNSDDDEENGPHSKRSSISSAQAISPEGKPVMWGGNVESLKDEAKTGKVNWGAEGGGAAEGSIERKKEETPAEEKAKATGGEAAAESAEKGTRAPLDVEAPGRGGEDVLAPLPAIEDPSIPVKKKPTQYYTQSFDMSGDTDEWDADSAGGNTPHDGTPRNGTPQGSPVGSARGAGKTTKASGDERDFPMSTETIHEHADEEELAQTIHKQEEEPSKSWNRQEPVKETEQHA